ncbi:hypothetical protein K438DRAFT_1787629 [Mycena galopus ATCC 62051]|nr:hypothetical protein K438DRAFT_1787629 [Mycena galopus ATCC 62051]
MPPIKHSSTRVRTSSTSPLPRISNREARSLALKKCREKNRHLLRQKARKDMERLRATRKLSPEAIQAQQTQRKVHDFEYRESIYKPMLDFYGCGHLANIQLVDKTTIAPPPKGPPLKFVPNAEDAEDPLPSCTCLSVHVICHLCWSMATTNYCDPPFHPDPGYNPAKARNIFYLCVNPNARSPGPGIYTSWESCRRVITGISGAGGVRYASQEECVLVWRVHCIADHDHPPIAFPATTEAPAPQPPAYTPAANTTATRDTSIAEALGFPDEAALLSAFEAVAISSDFRSRSRSGPSPSGNTLFFAIRGGSVVHHDYHSASQQLAEMQRTDPSSILHSSPSHAYATFVAGGLSHEDALAFSSPPTSPTRTPGRRHCPHPEAEAEGPDSEPELLPLQYITRGSPEVHLVGWPETPPSRPSVRR